MRLREEREFEREKEKAAAARQAMYDALALADRGALPTAQSQALGQRAVGEIAKSVSGAMGAFQSGAQTPFDAGAIARGAGRIGEPAAKFTVGGVEYALPDQEQRRRALAAQEAATRRGERETAEREEENRRIREEQRAAQRLRDLSTAAKKGGRRSEAAIELAAANQAAYRALFPEEPRQDPMDALRVQEAMRERDLQEAQGMAFLDANRRNPAVTNAYASVFARNPKMSPGMVGYSIMQQELAGALAAQREASAGASVARTDATKAKTGGGRAPSSSPPGAGPVGTPAAPARDELDMAYDRYTTPKR
jgi:hypothetical protein